VHILSLLVRDFLPTFISSPFLFFFSSCLSFVIYLTWQKERLEWVRETNSMDRIKIILGITLETSYEVVYKVATQKRREKRLKFVCAFKFRFINTIWKTRNIKKMRRKQKNVWIASFSFSSKYCYHISCALKIINSFVEGEARTEAFLECNYNFFPSCLHMETSVKQHVCVRLIARMYWLNVTMWAWKRIRKLMRIVMGNENDDFTLFYFFNTNCAIPIVVHLITMSNEIAIMN
jgi:hypothetical protein